MKITITKDAKDNWMTVSMLPVAKQIIKDMKDEDAAADLSILAGMFHGETPKEYTAEMSLNSRVWEQYGENSGHMDIWITAVIDSWWNKEIYKVGCYLSDIWQSDGDNTEELKSHMYILTYKLVEQAR